MNASDCARLIDEIAQDPQAINELTDEQVAELRKYSNPYGTCLPANEKFAVISLINYKDEEWRKINTTALVAYMWRSATEYNPTRQLDAVERDFVAARDVYLAEAKVIGVDATVSNNFVADLVDAKDKKKKTMTDTARGVVREFLRNMFDYNPDIHARSAQQYGTDSATLDARLSAIKRQCGVAEKNPDEKLSAQPENLYKYLREHTLALSQELKSTTKALLETIKVLKGGVGGVSGVGVSIAHTATTTTTNADAMSVDNAIPILTRKYQTLLKHLKDVELLANPMAAADTLGAWKLEPPADVFFNFNRYYNNHYHQLVEATRALYGTNPDFEYSITFYESFDSETSARTYLQAHEGDFKIEPVVVGNNGITLLGPFTENRAKIDFYNKHTEILKQIQESTEADQKLGIDLMKKSAAKGKKKNIEEMGAEDAAGLDKYMQASSVMSRLGGAKRLTPDEKQELEKARLCKEDMEVPDDCIQLDVFSTKVDADGNASMDRRKLYTQAEDPLHMTDPAFADSYQPVRAKDKKIIGRDGTVLTIPAKVRTAAPTEGAVKND